jgi:hypothetical protein
VAVLNPAFAAAIVGVSAWRKLMYSLVWQSVMWRPGTLRFLIGVKNPLQSGRPRPPENTAPCGAAPVVRFATSVGLRPPFVANPATLSHPDRRAFLIPSVAQQAISGSASFSHSNTTGNRPLMPFTLKVATRIGLSNVSALSLNATPCFPDPKPT